MSPEDYKDLMEHAPKAIGETVELVGREYDALWRAFEERGRTMLTVARLMRERLEKGWNCDIHYQGMAALGSIRVWADELDPPEPLSEADAAEKFSQQCAARKPTASSEPSGSEQP